ncbi:SDR family NAD(P)-dependent oxidoreductase [Flavitalea sp.]|nr:glucose 1-dehydrogenase [Flavitalea sp.]
MFRLDNKTAVITGGGSGIGKAIALLFSRRGADVYIIDMNEEGGKAVAHEIIEAGGIGVFKKCNVAIQAEVKNVVHSIERDAGAIHILVNNAGIAHVGNLEKTSEDDFNRITEVNVKGVYNCLHEIVPVMKKTGGVIVNMASVASAVGIPDRFAYSMSKGAVIGMTLSVAKDYIKEGIRCNSISPGRVHTPFVDGFIAKNYPGQEKEMFEKLSKTQPIGRMAEPDEIANLALYLCSDEAAFVTGCDYPIDGGFIKLNT